MSRSKLFLSVVIPAFNEERNIVQTLQEHMQVLDSLSPRLSNYEVICLDDGSTDRTQELILEMQARNSRLRILVHKKNSGIFHSFKDLFLEAKGDCIYMTAGDGQYPAKSLLIMFDSMTSENLDLVVGVRSDREKVYGIRRRIVSFAFDALSKFMFTTEVKDAGSVKLGNRPLFTSRLISKSPFAEAERIIKASSEGKRIGFVHIPFIARSTGKARGASWKNIFSSVYDLVRCYFFYQLCHKKAGI